MTDLPCNVRPEIDRHGKVRHRFRKVGYGSHMVPGAPGSPEMLEAVAAILRDGKLPVKGAESAFKPEPKSLDDLFRRYKTSLHWTRNSARYQHVASQVIERFLDRVDSKGRRFGRRPVERVTVGWLDRQFAGMSATPGAANDLRKKLKGLMNHAIRLEWRETNPVALTAKYRDGKGLHDWTDDEIEQYRAHHPLGTMARLTLELALNTAARRCNVARIERDHIREGRIHVAHAKDNNAASVPMLSTTRAAIEALPAAPIRFLIVTQFGKQFTDAGLGNRMRKWCNEAGLPQCSLHGLRKAMSRRLAERGATDAEGQAVTGHKKAETFQEYRAGANRALLADAAMARFETEIAEPDAPENCRTSANDWKSDEN